MKSLYLTLFIVAVLCMTGFAGCSGQIVNEPEVNDWIIVEDGISYKEISMKITDEQEKDLVVVKADPRKYSFHIYQNTARESSKNIKEIHEETGSLLTFNGAYFTEDFKPTGLLIKNGQTIRDISNADLLDGILAISNSGTAYIFDTNTFKNNPTIEFAIQNGPIIYKDGKMRVAEENTAASSRTVIGTDKDNQIIIIILKRNLLNPLNTISLYEMARLINESSQLSSLGLQSVLNLDGGGSTGLMVDDKYFAEMEKVQNVIITKKR
jgi:exopolysaccharide biosynthesis protein